MGAGVTDDERRIFAGRLVAMQQTLRTVFEACEAQAELCKSAGAHRLAFSIFMVRENLIGYSKELNAFVLKVMAGDDLADDDDEIRLDY